MDVIAKTRFLRMSPRKVRLVTDLIRGLPVAAAEAQLTFLRKAAAGPVLKLLKSAVANAEHNFKLHREELRVRSVAVDGGPTLKRFHPRAFGRAASIRKRTSHITLVVSDGKTGTGKQATAAAPAKKPARAAASKA